MREATSAYNARYHAEHRESILQRKALSPERRYVTSRRIKASNRAILDRIKMEHGCAVCGENDPIVLHFHHREPTEKKFFIGKMLAGGMPIKRILGEVDKCDVLCANCHARVTWGSRLDKDAAYLLADPALF